jgi:hypothetical protein
MLKLVRHRTGSDQLGVHHEERAFAGARESFVHGNVLEPRLGRGQPEPVSPQREIATKVAHGYQRAGRHAAAISAATTHSAPHTTTAVFQPASRPAAPASPPPVASATTSATPAAPPR